MSKGDKKCATSIARFQRNMQILNRKGWLIILICVVIWIALSWAHDEFFWDLKAPVIDKSFFLITEQCLANFNFGITTVERKIAWFFLSYHHLRRLWFFKCGGTEFYCFNALKQLPVKWFRKIEYTAYVQLSICVETIETSSGKMKGRRLIKRFFLPFHWAVNMNEFKTIDVF